MKLGRIIALVGAIGLLTDIAYGYFKSQWDTPIGLVSVVLILVGALIAGIGKAKGGK